MSTAMTTPGSPPVSSTLEEEKKHYKETSFDAEVASHAPRLRGHPICILNNLLSRLCYRHTAMTKGLCPHC